MHFHMRLSQEQWAHFDPCAVDGNEVLLSKPFRKCGLLRFQTWFLTEWYQKLN